MFEMTTKIDIESFHVTYDSFILDHSFAHFSFLRYLRVVFRIGKSFLKMITALSFTQFWSCFRKDNIHVFCCSSYNHPHLFFVSGNLVRKKAFISPENMNRKIYKCRYLTSTIIDLTNVHVNRSFLHTMHW